MTMMIDSYPPLGHTFSLGMVEPGVLLEWAVNNLRSGDEGRAEAALSLVASCLQVRQCPRIWQI